MKLIISFVFLGAVIGGVIYVVMTENESSLRRNRITAPPAQKSTPSPVREKQQPEREEVPAAQHPDLVEENQELLDTNRKLGESISVLEGQLEKLAAENNQLRQTLANMFSRSIENGPAFQALTDTSGTFGIEELQASVREFLQSCPTELTGGDITRIAIPYATYRREREAFNREFVEISSDPSLELMEKRLADYTQRKKKWQDAWLVTLTSLLGEARAGMWKD